MKFSEAMKLFEDGHKIRSKSWGEGEFICSHGFNCNPESLWASSRQVYWCLSSNDWEIYQEPEELLPLQKMCEGLKLGKKFKRKSWNSDIHICWCSISGIYLEGKGNYNYILTVSIDLLTSDDWIEVT